MKTFSLKKNATFDIAQTLDCGQVFRYKCEGGVWRVNALEHILLVTPKADEDLFECDDEEFFRNYLDFGTNYDIIQGKVQDKGLVASAIEFGKGIRILRQNVVETLFSFLVSQNNNIPRIKGTIERMCDALGEDMGGYKAFPKVESIAAAPESFFTSIGAGYRAEYLSKCARNIVENGLPDFEAMSTPDARQALMGIKGVGRKVADCVLLFGLNRTDVFPVDTWILKVFEEEYKGVSAERLAPLLVQKYGESSGYVQQWLYYFKRSQKKV